MGTTSLNLWVVLQKRRKPCGERVLGTSHEGVFSELRPLTTQNSAEEGAGGHFARSSGLRAIVVLLKSIFVRNASSD